MEWIFSHVKPLVDWIRSVHGQRHMVWPSDGEIPTITEWWIPVIDSGLADSDPDLVDVWERWIARHGTRILVQQWPDGRWFAFVNVGSDLSVLKSLHERMKAETIVPRGKVP